MESSSYVDAFIDISTWRIAFYGISSDDESDDESDEDNGINGLIKIADSFDELEAVRRKYSKDVLYGAIGYLAGPVDAPEDHGKAWRIQFKEYIKQKGIKVKLLDPTDKLGDWKKEATEEKGKTKEGEETEDSTEEENTEKESETEER
jgi:hypothetical protein